MEGILPRCLLESFSITSLQGNHNGIQTGLNQFVDKGWVRKPDAIGRYLRMERTLAAMLNPFQQIGIDSRLSADKYNFSRTAVRTQVNQFVKQQTIH